MEPIVQAALGTYQTTPISPDAASHQARHLTMEVAGKTCATASARNLNRKSRALRSRATQQVTPDVVGAPVLGDETMAFVALLRQRRADLRSASLPWSQVDKDLTVIDLRVKLRALNGVAGSEAQGPTSVEACVGSSASTASECKGSGSNDTSNYSTSDDDYALGSASLEARVGSSASTASECKGCVGSDTCSTSGDDNSLGISVASIHATTDDGITLVVSDVIDSKKKRGLLDIPLCKMKCPPPRR
jgi:hypothetical protein